MWAGAFALSHCPGVQANTQSPSVRAPQGRAQFQGGVFVLHYWLEELVSQPIDIPCFSKPDLYSFCWALGVMCCLHITKKSLKLLNEQACHRKEQFVMKLPSCVVFPLSRQVGVCSITIKDDLWEHSEEETEKHRVVLLAGELLTRTCSSWTFHFVYSILIPVNVKTTAFWIRVEDTHCCSAALKHF